MGYIIGAIVCWSSAIVLSGWAWWQYNREQDRQERIADLIDYKIPSPTTKHIDTYL